MSTTDEPDAKDERPDEESRAERADRNGDESGNAGHEAESPEAHMAEASDSPIPIEVRMAEAEDGAEGEATVADRGQSSQPDPAPPVAEDFANKGSLAEARERKRLQDEIARLNGVSYQLRAEVNRASEDRASEKDELVQQLRKLQTEFTNHRRRVERERDEQVRHANGELIAQLLPIVDSFERAIKSWQGESGEDFFKGIELIYRMLQDLLVRYDVRSIKTVGVEFDPNVHEAVMREHSDDLPENHVIAVYESGYYLGEKLLRPARVVVSAPGSGGDAETAHRAQSSEGPLEAEDLADTRGDGSDPEAERS